MDFDTGYKVYRHNGHYFFHHYYSSASPPHLGLSILHEVPRNVSEEEFAEWLRLTGEDLDEQFTDGSMRVLVSSEPPSEQALDSGWTYEIDLDNRVLHIDYQPMFRLDHLPPDNVFLASISYDSFGIRGFHESMPAEYRYDWRSPPPVPATSSVKVYNLHFNGQSIRPIHELLGIPQTLSGSERARTRLVELLVTQLMSENDSVGYELRRLENVPNRDHISENTFPLALSFVDFAIGPAIPSLPRAYNGPWDFIWLRRDVCLRITTHLDDEGNFQAAMGDLIEHIMATRGKGGVVYGIACSLFLCAVIRIDKTAGGAYTHTSALQFLPSFYARTSSTPGIDALSRLGCQANGVELIATISEMLGMSDAPASKPSIFDFHMVKELPFELWLEIGRFIVNPKDLVHFASISSQTMSAAAVLAQYPLVMDYRLVDVIGPPSSIPDGRRDFDINQWARKGRGYKELRRAKFKGISDGCLVSLELLLLPGIHYPIGRQPISSKVWNYCPLLEMEYDELYVSE